MEVGTIVVTFHRSTDSQITRGEREAFQIMDTKEIAEKLVAHCRKGDFEAAQEELFAPDAVSIEPKATPLFPKETKGLDAIIKKGHTFNSTLEKIHSITVADPLVAGHSFTTTIAMDITMKGIGRVPMSEICVYQVKDGKVISEQFFYDTE